MTADRIEAALQAEADREKAAVLQRFFKTGPGEYGEGDHFLGVTMPKQRAIAKRFYRDSTPEDLDRLLRSGVHEYRMTALLILVIQFEKERSAERQEVLVDYYLASRVYINNWDLVDVTCYKILGPWLLERDRRILFELVREESIWSKRMAIITTMHFIRNHDHSDTLSLAEILLHHPHDLIHKAVGWMLREVGNRDGELERAFLAEHYHDMPRTMLRYAIEKFPEPERRAYLEGRA